MCMVESRACLSCLRKDVGVLGQWQPLPNKPTDTARARKAFLIQSCYKTFRLIESLLLPTPPRTWRRWTGSQLKTRTTTIKADPLSDHESSAAQLDLVEVSSELAHDRRAWGATLRDAVSSIGDVGWIHPRWMPTQVQESTSKQWSC